MILIVRNPASGNQKSSLLLDALEAGIPVTQGLRNLFETLSTSKFEVVETTANGDWKPQLLSKVASKKPKALAVIGGDGTLRDVASLLYLSKIEVPLIPIPSGRGNDFLRGLCGYEGEKKHGFFWSWLEEKKNLEWKSSKVDLIHVHQNYFINMASLGYGGEIVQKTHDRNAFWSQSSSVYQIEGAIALLQVKENPARITYEFEGQSTSFEFPVFGSFVSNGKSNGSGLFWTPKAEVQDGILDAIFFRKPSVLQMWESLKAVKKKEEPAFEYCRVQASKLKIEFEKPCALEIDGEFMESSTSLDFEVCPHAVTVVTPSFSK